MYAQSDDMWPQDEESVRAPCNEDERLAVLAAFGVDSLVDDPELSRIAALAARICETPIALVSIVEKDRQRFIARLGLESEETPRNISFCAHAMLSNEAMVVTDATTDPRFRANPLVTAAPHIRFYAGQPLVSPQGAPIGSLCVIDQSARPEGLTEVQRETLEVLAEAVMRRLESQRQSSEAALQDQRTQQRVQQVLDSVPGIAWSADAELNFDYFNARWNETTGAPAPTSVEEWAAFVETGDFARSAPEFRAAVHSGVPYETELRVRHIEHGWRWMKSRVVPTTTPDGERRWVGTLTDVHEEHRQREAKDLLANELSHRIKNIFAVVAGLIAIRSRGKPEVSEFAGELGAAIHALGTAHDFVRPLEGRSSDCLLELLRDLLAPYHGDGDARVAIDGDDVSIAPRAATPLALIFHELATNSAKYGALSDENGRISINVVADGTTIAVTWRETMVKACEKTAPEHEGFGSRLLRMAVESQLEGSFSREFSEDGVIVQIAFPAEKIAA